MDKAIKVKLEAAEQVVRELIDPLEKFGNPETLIGKPYEEWTPQDLNMLITLYGKEEPNPLSNLIFRKTYDAVKELENEEAGL